MRKRGAQQHQLLALPALLAAPHLAASPAVRV
jgi:hypothetical protein